MGAKHYEPFQLSFNGSLRVDFQGSWVTSDGGLILVRELDERLGSSELIAQHFTDPRRGKNTQRPVADLLRQSVYGCLAGDEDVNDAERVSQDPTVCLIGSEKIWARGTAPTSRWQSFETERLTPDENVTGPAQINRALIAMAAALVSGGTGGAERALSGATWGTQEEKGRGNDSKGGTFVDAHTKPGDQPGNPGSDSV
jgi:Transposase DDE domain group 1